MENMEKILSKILRYCAYQERCTLDVRNKLLTLGVGKEQIQEILDYLEKEGFLNEERYARAYARGKFRINGWGKRKIKAGLIAKGIGNSLISTALEEEIDPEAYLEKLRETVKEKGVSTAVSRGFEPWLVMES